METVSSSPYCFSRWNPWRHRRRQLARPEAETIPRFDAVNACLDGVLDAVLNVDRRASCREGGINVIRE